MECGGVNLYLERPLEQGVGIVSQWFGEHPEWYAKYGLAGHNGIDYACPLGSHVLPMHPGKVVAVGKDPKGYGLYVKIRNTLCESVYAHLGKVLVKDGDMVMPFVLFALSGNTGNSTGPHLHTGFRIHGMRNPAYLNYIDFVPFRDI